MKLTTAPIMCWLFYTNILLALNAFRHGKGPFSLFIPLCASWAAQRMLFFHKHQSCVSLITLIVDNLPCCLCHPIQHALYQFTLIHWPSNLPMWPRHENVLVRNYHYQNHPYHWTCGTEQSHAIAKVKS